MPVPKTAPLVLLASTLQTQARRNAAIALQELAQLMEPALVRSVLEADTRKQQKALAPNVAKVNFSRRQARVTAGPVLQAGSKIFSGRRTARIVLLVRSLTPELAQAPQTALHAQLVNSPQAQRMQGALYALLARSQIVEVLQVPVHAPHALLARIRKNQTSAHAPHACLGFISFTQERQTARRARLARTKL